ncbi:hypothetical protein [Bacillus sp. JCM 19034]|uniref:hypothetical protein n=1 Tax=Bacillus sp. JCM 19034 TaxID=1481928 RepID=UPI000AB8467B|nr:hypothetical protein [Bacillus sp. JCM 19034]
MRNTKTMTEGAIMAAIVTILLLLTLYVPLVNSIVMWHCHYRLLYLRIVED